MRGTFYTWGYKGYIGVTCAKMRGTFYMWEYKGYIGVTLGYVGFRD